MKKTNNNQTINAISACHTIKESEGKVIFGCSFFSSYVNSNHTVSLYHEYASYTSMFLLG